MGIIDSSGRAPIPQSETNVDRLGLKGIGNIEFSNCFLVSYFENFNLQKLYSEIDKDPRVSLYYESLNQRLGLSEGMAGSVYQNLLMEAGNRGLDVAMMAEGGARMYGSEVLWDWLQKMRETPTYIREIWATNELGNQDIDGFEVMLDYPVREACKLLNKKGYRTYWSSANEEDFNNRHGNVVADKSVAYILIDYHNLTPELKKELFLNGRNKYWGVAQSFDDDGKYYGVYAELTSGDMRCDDVSDKLVERVSGLPDLKPVVE
jgi:hypothetical protein